MKIQKLYTCNYTWDCIFLQLLYSDLINLRSLQSEYVKKVTAFDNYYDAVLSQNYLNMEWLRQNNCSWNNDAFELAVKNNDLIAIKILIEIRCPWVTSQGPYLSKSASSDAEIFTQAVNICNLELMKWLEKMGCPKQLNIEHYKTNTKSIFMWLISIGCVLSKTAFSLAVFFGCRQKMQLLLDFKCPWNFSAYQSAIKNTSFEDLNWLFNNGCPATSETFAFAIKSKNFNILIWVLGKQFPINASTIKYIIKSNNKKVINIYKKFYRF